MPVFDHDRLDAYQLSLDFVVLADAISVGLSHGRRHLANQLNRAATSVCLNIAEGAGEFSPADKARFYRMARRSATECAAVLDILERLAAGRTEPLASGREILARVVSMLVRLAQRGGHQSA